MELLNDRIREQLIADILTGRFAPGGRFPTEQETAERFNASRVTVRSAYGALEQAGIIIRRKRSGTTVADTFNNVGEEIRTVAAVVPLRDPFARVFLETFCSEAAERNAMVLLEPDSSDGNAQNRAIFRLAANGVRNLVVWGLDRRLDFELVTRLRVLGVSLIFFDRILPGSVADYVGLDNRDAIRALLEAARADGFDRFAYFDTALDVDSNRERRKAFLEFSGEPESSVVEISSPQDIAKFFRAEERKAVLCVNDPLALTAAPLLPSGCRLYSVDGTAEALAAGIVSYRQPMRKMAAACFSALEKQRRSGANWKAGERRFPGEVLRPC